MMLQLAGVALGGAIGSLCRFGLSRWLAVYNPHAAFSVGVLAANLVGCLLMGFLFVRVQALEPPMRDTMAAFLLTGCLGGLTTYSSYAMELYRLGVGEAWKWLALYVTSHLVLGLAAISAGVALANASLKP